MGESAKVVAPDCSRISFRNRIITSFLDRHSGAYWDKNINSTQRQIDADSILLDRMSERGCAETTLRIWQNHNCLVVPKRWQVNPHFERAKRRCPIPVALRISGGSAVVHGSHILNISFAQQIERCNTEELFRPVIDYLIPVLRELGLDADIGFVPGAHCNGKYNVRSSGKKLAGTAAFTRILGGFQYAITHAAVSIWENKSDLNTINAFETDLGHKPAHTASAHTSIESETNQQH
ncbi:lipoate--protein ligase family protein [Sphingorhabdus sp. Alg231-15]|uniref:lipoate--protein ligase family protein n=1 Tax=Sphingorhabdus sp. Alg231-15 TaxID=1922222 RepID=UPI00307B3FD8